MKLTNPLTNRIDQTMPQEPPRPHLGMSTLGHHCDRWLWLSFRWAVVEQFDGRILRLFRRGQMEETTVVADLRRAGLVLRCVGNDQMRVDMGCHVSGSVDGVIDSGVPEAPAKRHILEIKTHSKKSFDDLEKNGVEKSKPMHWCQMQCYMLASGIDRALYVGVCKDDDRIHAERVRFDRAAAERLIERGHRIALSERMPEPCPGAAIDWYQCRFCAAHEFCHTTKLTKMVTCRNCAHSTPTECGAWVCERHGGGEIPTEFQRTGCDSHVIHPDLVPWQLDPSSTATEAVWQIGEHKVRNGDPCAFVYSSRELIENTEQCCTADNVVNELRERFDGRITRLSE